MRFDVEGPALTEAAGVVPGVSYSTEVSREVFVSIEDKEESTGLLLLFCAGFLNSERSMADRRGKTTPLATLLVDVVGASVTPLSESMSEEFAMEEAGREVATALPLRPLDRRPELGSTDMFAAGAAVAVEMVSNGFDSPHKWEEVETRRRRQQEKGEGRRTVAPCGDSCWSGH